MRTPERALPRHRQVYLALERGIRDGRWKPGDRLPSEAQLTEEFDTSRITVGRAVRDLQVAGLVDRQAGSGTFVRPPLAAAAHSFGLLIPDLGETEIFEPICRGMMASPLARPHALLWGSAAEAGADAGLEKEEAAWALCLRLIERRVSGVFFAPLEFTPARDQVNARILRALDEAGIPVVLLDRPAAPFPVRRRHDLVGLDDRHAGWVVAEHLRALGARRIGFVAVPGAAATVLTREGGWRAALRAAGAEPEAALAARLDPDDEGAVAAWLEAARPDAAVCANDRTAARLMRSVQRLGRAVPRDLRLCGIDDADLAALLPVPLTSLRQPTAGIGAAALAAMLERVAGADFPPREIRLQGTLVVRRSCGAVA